MALVVSTTARKDELLAAVASAPTVSTDLGGDIELPPLPASRTVDVSATAEASFSASHWSTTLPHGFGVARRRAGSSYDADLLDYFRQLAQLEEEYSAGLQRLTERLTREQPDADQSSFSGGGSRARATGAWYGILGQGTRPLARSMQYASVQRGWASVQQAVRAQAQAHRALAEDLRTTVLKPLEGELNAAGEREQAVVAPTDEALAQVRVARTNALHESVQYGRLLHRVRKEARRQHARAATAPEAMLLFEAARSCSEAVSEANALTARFERELEGRAIDALQEHEERRLESVDAALNAFASAAHSSAALPTEATASMREAVSRIDVPADICGFATTYRAAASRGIDPLTPPSFCDELAPLADLQEAHGFWGALWRPLKVLAASILGDDGRDEPRPRLPLTMEIVETAAADATSRESQRTVADDRLDPIDSPPAVTHSASTQPPLSSFESFDDGPSEHASSSSIESTAAHALDHSPAPPPKRQKSLEGDGPVHCEVAQLGSAGAQAAPGTQPAECSIASAEQQSDGMGPQTTHGMALDDVPCADAPGAAALDGVAGPEGILGPSGRRESLGSLDETEAILCSVDEMVAGLGGTGLTMAEAIMLQEEVLGADGTDAGASASGSVAHAADSIMVDGQEVPFCEGEWYYVDLDGEVQGPHTWAEMLHASHALARLRCETYTFMEGMSEWVTADAVHGLLLPPSPPTTAPVEPIADVSRIDCEDDPPSERDGELETAWAVSP